MIRPPNEKAEKFPVNALLELPSERYRSFFTKADASANNLQLSNAVNPAGFSIFISIPSRMPTVTPAIEVSVGLGLPVLNGRINTAFYYDRLQLQGNALRRDIMGFTVTYTLSEKFYQVKL